MISFEQFAIAAKTHNVIPLVTTVLADTHTPVSLYLAYRADKRRTFLLESVEPSERVGRFSFIGGNPIVTLTARGQEVEIQNGSEKQVRRSSMIDVLKEVNEALRHEAASSRNPSK